LSCTSLKSLADATASPSFFFASFSTKFAALSLVHDPLNKSIGEILGFLKDHKYAKAIIHLPAANHHADGHV
jgi:hypothetical protein